MSQKGIRIKGFPAAVIIVALAAFAGFRLLQADSTLDGDGREVLHQWIAAEYARYQLARTDLTDQERVPFLLASDSVEFRSLSARGRPDRTVVRVELEPNSAQPPDAPMVRYYRMRYSTVTGWQLGREVTVVSYYLSF